MLRLLLLIYPASFRSEYGALIRTALEQHRRDSPGFLPAAAFWAATIADTFVSASAAHLDILRHDLGYTARTLARSPGFALTAITVAALGIGATAAAMAMLDHVLVRPLPFPDQDRLVKLYEDHQSNGRQWDLAPANYRDWKRLATSFDRAGAFHNISVNLGGNGDPQRLEAAAVTPETFPILDVPVWLGRTFAAEDDRDGAPATAVLSYPLWQSAFGADPSIIGRTVLLDGAPCTIIGVMPRGFYFPTREAQLWTAMRLPPDAFADRTNTFIYGIAKLRRNVPLERAQAELSTIAARLAHEYPAQLAHTGASIIRMRDEVSDKSRLMLKALAGAALCLLIIACTNLANLLLARAMQRSKEIAVRSALGAGRERLIRQILTESLVIAILGGIGGIAIARVALPLLARLVPISLPIAAVPAIDLRILLFSAALTCGTAIAFGVFPAFRSSRPMSLREGGRSGIGGRGERTRSILVVAQVAASMVLLVGCGVLARALWQIQSINPGFQTDNTITLRTTLPMPRYEDRAVREQFYTRVLDSVKQLPGVQNAAYISFLPMTMRGGIWPVEVAGHPQDISSRRTASLRFVTPGFFDTMRIPLISGRDVSESDTFHKHDIAIVSQSFARTFWPGENPIGRHFDFGNADRTVAGVVGDVRVRGLERSSEPQVYLPYKQHDRVAMFYAPKDLVVRTSGAPESLVPAIRRIIREADPEQPVSDVRTLAAIVDEDVAGRAVQVRALAAFTIVALLLAAIGIHGLLSFTISSRTQEIGVRMALGATPAGIVSMTCRTALRLAAIGILFGVPLAYAVTRWLQSLLAGVQPGDALSFGLAIAVCLAACLAGSFRPALAASRVDPAAAIRAE